MNTHVEPSSASATDSSAQSTIDLDKLLAELSLVANPLQAPPRAAIHRFALAAHQTHVLSAVIELKRLQLERTDPVQNIAKMPLSALAFSLIADVSVVASQLMDKKDVTACTCLDKLTSDAVDMIAKTHDRLVGEKEHLGAAIEWFESATDPVFFEGKVKAGDLSSNAVYHEIERRAACLLACQVSIAAALTGPRGTGDWPPQEKPAAPTKKQAR